MALGEDEAVSFLPFGILRVDLHHAAVKAGHHICNGEASAHMTNTDLGDHLNCLTADVRSKTFELLFLHLSQQFEHHPYLK